MLVYLYVIRLVQLVADEIGEFVPYNVELGPISILCNSLGVNGDKFRQIKKVEILILVLNSVNYPPFLGNVHNKNF